MIGKLKGRIDTLEEDHLIIDVAGVGYCVFCSARTIASLAVGEAASLTIETHAREDHIHLYGFETTVERDWFRLLCSVQGVGNKTGLAILSAYPPEALARAILARDIAAFKAISGIGPKLAERIVVELKDKALKLPVDGGSWIVDGGKKTSEKSPSTTHQPPITNDAISALTNLGYSRTEAYAAVMKHAHAIESLDQLIRLGLRELVRE